MFGCTKELGVVKRKLQRTQIRYYYPTCLWNVGLCHLFRQSLATFLIYKHKCLFASMNKDIKQFIPTEDMLANFLHNLLRKYLYQVTNMYGRRTLEFLFKIQDGLRHVFVSVWTLVSSSVKWEFGLTTFWRVAAHALHLAWRCVLL